MFLERRCNGQQTAIDVLQMLEVKRPLLLAGEFVGEDGVDRAANDARFDERARVDADDGNAVVTSNRK